ncbi:hypothetical protein [Roseibium aggregatum]|jgi:hypothetical protein|uniref:hypothetical protein n=1 Tax=Roseibium aggregatum TaxID=187304 RepID=UPI001E556FED|nr:hypothetical protein [Roseibium aggregatum]UES51572.1 hypothetical protein GFK88_19310 [Roseibium aggregatum]
MADLSITPANVISGAGSIIDRGTGGAAITAGQPVYKDSADDKYKLSDCDSATEATRQCDGIALNGCADGQPLAVHKSGPLTVGAVLTAGQAYYLSATPGGIAPYADLGSGDYPVLLGIASSDSVLKVAITAAGVAL